MVVRMGVEPTTFRLGGGCSLQLSYRTIYIRFHYKICSSCLGKNVLPRMVLRRRLHSPAVLRGHGYTLTSLLTNENLELYLLDVPQILFDSNH